MIHALGNDPLTVIHEGHDPISLGINDVRSGSLVYVKGIFDVRVDDNPLSTRHAYLTHSNGFLQSTGSKAA